MIYGGHFDPEIKKKRIKELENIMNSSNFWDDKENSEKVLSELNILKNKLSNIEELKEHIESNISIIELIKLENDKEMYDYVESDISNIT